MWRGLRRHLVTDTLTLYDLALEASMSHTQNEIHIERVDSSGLLRHIEFDEDRAEIEVPSYALASMPFEASCKLDNADYWREVDRVRLSGHNNAAAIVLYPRPDGKWDVEDGDALRFAAIKKVSGEFFTNLLGSKVGRVRFSLRGSSRDGAYQAPRFTHGGGD